MRLSRKVEPWIPMFCPRCNVDIDVPRVEWVTCGTLYCEECSTQLVERSQENPFSVWDEDVAMERRYDAADLEYDSMDRWND